MSDDTNETGASQEDQVVTDDDLVRAAAETGESDEKEPDVEPVTGPEPVIEPDKPVEGEPEGESGPVVDEPVDPSERSALGRKVAEQSEAMSAFGEQLSRIEQVLGRIPVPKETELIIEEDLDEPQLFTKREVKELVQAEKGLDAKAWDEFDKEISTQGAKAKDNNEMFQKVCDEVSANWMPRDARKANAELIYSQAKNAVLSKMVAQPLDKVNPLKGEKPNNPLGKLPEEVVPAKEAPEIKLTEDEIRGAEGLGVSQEEFKKMLAEEGNEDIPGAGASTPI